MKITAKQNVWFNTMAEPQARRGKVPRRMPDRDEVEESVALAEFLDWVAMLDDLARRAGSGQDEDARQLALAKLRFLLRRVQHLREQMMLGGRGQAKAGLERLAHLVEEWGQVLQELTGRQPVAVDDWPLPYRLYSRQAGALPSPGFSPRLAERRQRQRLGDNVLLPPEQEAALLVLHGIRFVLAVVGEGFGMAQHPLLLQVRARLAQLVPLQGQPGTAAI